MEKESLSCDPPRWWWCPVRVLALALARALARALAQARAVHAAAHGALGVLTVAVHFAARAAPPWPTISKNLIQ